jgi:flavin-dependent dehydrogenase
MADRFDVVVMGAGPTGEHAIGILLAANGLQLVCGIPGNRR